MVDVRRALLYDCSLNCITVDMMLPFNTVTVVNSFHLQIIYIGLYHFATEQTQPAVKYMTGMPCLFMSDTFRP